MYKERMSDLLHSLPCDFRRQFWCGGNWCADSWSSSIGQVENKVLKSLYYNLLITSQPSCIYNEV